MKKIATLILCAGALYLSSCESNETALTPENNQLATAEAQREVTYDVTAYDFPNVPAEVVAAAQEAYGSDSLPAMTIAFTYTRGNSNISLEQNWTFQSYTTPTEDCFLGEIGGRDMVGQITTEDGFAFIEADDLCGLGQYSFDNRQGGWFDYVCGPGNFNINYDGSQVFILIRLWCE